MNRRNFVIGLGALSAGGAATVGSGAFSTAEVNRDFTIEVADDSESLLALEPLDDDFAELDDDGVLVLSFGENEQGGQGVAPGSSYFIPDVFEVRNQGTQPVTPFQSDGVSDGVGIFITFHDADFQDTIDDLPQPPAPPTPVPAEVGNELPGPAPEFGSGGSSKTFDPGESEPAGLWVSVEEGVDFGEAEVTTIIEADT